MYDSSRVYTPVSVIAIPLIRLFSDRAVLAPPPFFVRLRRSTERSGTGCTSRAPTLELLPFRLQLLITRLQNIINRHSLQDISPTEPPSTDRLRTARSLSSLVVNISPAPSSPRAGLRRPMNRFRRKSESRSRRKEASSSSQREPSSEGDAPASAPTLLLPEPSNFRTSLILVSCREGAVAGDVAN